MFQSPPNDWVVLSSRNYFKGVDLAMNTTTRNILAVPVMSRSHGKDEEGKVVAVRQSVRLES